MLDYVTNAAGGQWASLSGAIKSFSLQFTGRMKSEGLKGGKEKEEVSWVVIQLVHLGIWVWPDA